MSKLNSYLSLMAALLISIQASAQGIGAHPSTVNWKEINTENVKVIFPENLEQNAFRIASIIDYIKKNNTFSVGEESKKVDLVLQTNQVASNGFVALGPYKSEFFATAPQNANFLGSQDWIDGLAIHEYRHTLQLVNGKKGLTKVASVVWGQTGWNIAQAFSVPPWYFEGDATVSETVLSEGGRGRLPSFFAEQRAILLNGKDYSYMKARNGSFKSLLPSHYPMGYAICNYVRNHYGAEVWSKILADGSSYRGILYPFSAAMKRHTGLNSAQMYHAAYDELKNQWEEELSVIKLTPTEFITPKTEKVLTYYSLPYFLKDGTIVTIKSSAEKIPAIYTVKDGREKKVTSIGIGPEQYMTVNNDRIAWAELQNDPRRQNRSFSRIVTYDMRTQTKKYLTSKTKYFSPEFSQDGKKLICVEADELLNNSLVIISSKDGLEQTKLPNPHNYFLSYPKWTKDDQSVVYTARHQSKLAVFKYDLRSKTTTTLLDWTVHSVGNISMGKDYLYCDASFSGIDNIYAIPLDGSQAIKQLSSVKTGASQPAVSADEKTLVMSELTEMGNFLTRMSIDPINNETITFVEPKDMGRYNVKTNDQEFNILDKIPDLEYDIKKYKGFLKGLKLHTWGFSQDSNGPQLSLEFDNILADVSARVQAKYNNNESASSLGGSVSFGKWFTILGVEGSTSGRNVDYYSADSIATESFDESMTSFGLSVPLSWVKGNTFSSFGVGAKYALRGTSNYELSEEPRSNLNFGALGLNASFSMQERTASQNVNTRLGFAVDLNYTMANGDVDSKELVLSNTIFLPGARPNHAFTINSSWIKKFDREQYEFSDQFNYARGYNSSPNDDAYKISLNYGFPIAYPDWGFGGLFYARRIRGNLFYDLSEVSFESKTSQQNSYGAEIILEFTALNFVPMNLGVRQSQLLNNDVFKTSRKSRFEIFTAVAF